MRGYTLITCIFSKTFLAKFKFKNIAELDPGRYL